MLGLERRRVAPHGRAVASVGRDERSGRQEEDVSCAPFFDLRFDFGESLRTGEPAAAMVLRAFPATLQLAGVTMLLTVVLAIIIGSWAALKPNGVADRIASFFSMASCLKSSQSMAS